MARFIKMALYGEPGVGKSTFAAKAPKPYFITTDGNYEYLEDFCGAKPQDHIQVNSWKEMQKAFQQDFSNYETIVVDLVEDSYMWAENEFCKDNKIVHISDFGYGKGYAILANDFFIEYQKLLALPKNIILIFHGISEVLKDRRGIEYTKYGPTKLIREKIVTQIEGRVRFFVRAFAETDEDEKGNLVTKRYMSLSPDGQTEYGITRGLTGDIPRYIPLDWDVFYEIATRYDPIISSTSSVSVKDGNDAVAIKKDAIKALKKEKAKVEKEPKPTEEETIDEIREKLKKVSGIANIQPVEEKPIEETPQPELYPTEKESPAVKAEPEVKPLSTNDNQALNQMSAADKMAAIKAKMAALKGLK